MSSRRKEEISFLGLSREANYGISFSNEDLEANANAHKFGSNRMSDTYKRSRAQVEVCRRQKLAAIHEQKQSCYSEEDIRKNLGTEEKNKTAKYFTQNEIPRTSKMEDIYNYTSEEEEIQTQQLKRIRRFDRVSMVL